MRYDVWVVYGHGISRSRKTIGSQVEMSPVLGQCRARTSVLSFGRLNTRDLREPVNTSNKLRYRWRSATLITLWFVSYSLRVIKRRSPIRKFDPCGIITIYLSWQKHYRCGAYRVRDLYPPTTTIASSAKTHPTHLHVSPMCPA